MKTFCRIMVLSLMAFSFEIQLGHAEKSETNTESIKKAQMDLRPIMKSLTLREGVNPIHKDSQGRQISAVVKGGKIINWMGTGANGDKLPVSYKKGITCRVCIESPGGTLCYDVNCDDLPKPKTSIY